LLLERKDLEESLAALKNAGRSLPDRLEEFLELAGSLYLQYKIGLPEEKRDLLKIVTSNRHVEGKNLAITMSFPFCEVANRGDKGAEPGCQPQSQPFPGGFHVPAYGGGNKEFEVPI